MLGFYMLVYYIIFMVIPLGRMYIYIDIFYVIVILLYMQGMSVPTVVQI